MRVHGTYWGYCSGCRCAYCKKANNAAKQRVRDGLSSGELRQGTFGVKIGTAWAAIAARFLRPILIDDWSEGKINRKHWRLNG